MDFLYKIQMTPSILEPEEEGSEGDLHHDVSFSATYYFSDAEGGHIRCIPPRTFPRLQFFAEGPEIIRETLANSSASLHISEVDTDRIVMIIRDKQLPEISANYRAKRLSICLRIFHFMSNGVTSTIFSDWFRSQSIADNLPVVDIDGGDEEGKDLMCSICLKELGSGRSANSEHIHHSNKKIVVRMPCSHMFDKDCLVEWFKRSLTCPMCRYIMPIPSAGLSLFL